METRTVPAHAVIDSTGAVVSVVLLNGKAPEFYQVSRMGFEDIGGFLKDVTEQHEKTKRSKRGNKSARRVLEEEQNGQTISESHTDGNLGSGSRD